MSLRRCLLFDYYNDNNDVETPVEENNVSQKSLIKPSRQCLYNALSINNHAFPRFDELLMLSPSNYCYSLVKLKKINFKIKKVRNFIFWGFFRIQTGSYGVVSCELHEKHK